jgi:Domain of unknown function (DUF1849).
MRVPFGVFLVLAAGIGAVAAAPAGLAPHRAVYDLSLKDASESSGIDGMSGRMVYEFSGSACEGYTTKFRFVTQTESGETSRLTDQQTITFEDVRRHVFRFDTRSYVDQALDHTTKGEANLADGEVRVDLDEPDREVFGLGKALFPTEHMIELITRAKNGERFYESRIFDGSDNADEAMLTTTVIGPVKQPDATDREAAVAGGLAEAAYWPVVISYFNEKAAGDTRPSYLITFKLYENGVTRDLTMDYGDFVLQGKLAKLEMLPPKPCTE